jgi:mono/diheme cytochrome c family protein
MKKSVSLQSMLTAVVLSILAASGRAADADLPEASGVRSDLPATTEDSDLARGRYLVTIAGCNDCHTAGWMQSGGRVPEADWLQGDRLGWRGPWGTTYPINLRLYMNRMSGDQWVERAHTVQTRPPMPWWVLHAMSEDDLRSIYRFIRHLGPKGDEAPAYVPPGHEPKTPYVLMEPQAPKASP